MASTAYHFNRLRTVLYVTLLVIRLLSITNVPAVTIRFLFKLYLFQVTRVAWNGSYSHDIKILNGVH